MDQNNENKNKIVQTYAEDMTEAIENSPGGAIREIIREQEKNEIIKKELSPESKKNKLFMMLSFMLVLLAVTILAFFYFRTKDNIVEPDKQFTPLIFTDSSTFIEIKDLTKDQISQTVLNKVNTTNVKNGEVEGLYLTENKNIIGLRKFLEHIQSNFVPVDRALLSDNFLTGIVNGETQPSSSAGKNFFLLMKVNSISDVFVSLRDWENKIFTDLHGFFSVDISPETKYLLTKEFTDGIVQNKNARILYDSNNQIVMMYIMADDNSIIITNNENTAREVMLRLASAQIKK